MLAFRSDERARLEYQSYKQWCEAKRRGWESTRPARLAFGPLRDLQRDALRPDRLHGDGRDIFEFGLNSAPAHRPDTRK
jgi:hypothetical protein